MFGNRWSNLRRDHGECSEAAGQQGLDFRRRDRASTDDHNVLANEIQKRGKVLVMAIAAGAWHAPQ